MRGWSPPKLVDCGRSPSAMKVFISYATKDLSKAESVFAEIDGAGAEVFQWGRSEKIGGPSWPQILE